MAGPGASCGTCVDMTSNDFLGDTPSNVETPETFGHPDRRPFSSAVTSNLKIKKLTGKAEAGESDILWRWSSFRSAMMAEYASSRRPGVVTYFSRISIAGP